MIVALAGGVGAAKLLRGLVDVIAPETLTIISGTFTMKHDGSDEKVALNTGSYSYMPARMIHEAWAGDEGATFFAQLCAGRAGDERLLRLWNKTDVTRQMREAVARARIVPRISFHGLRHTWASLAVMNGVPLQVIAQNLGHADTRMAITDCVACWRSCHACSAKRLATCQTVSSGGAPGQRLCTSTSHWSLT